jgi:hypothetical protein
MDFYLCHRVLGGQPEISPNHFGGANAFSGTLAEGGCGAFQINIVTGKISFDASSKTWFYSATLITTP